MAQDREPITDSVNRRNFYRVQYPVTDRPAFWAGAVRGLVEDCSETGARVTIEHLPKDVEIKVADRMGVSIRFHRGDEVEAAGSVVRWDGKTLVLRFDRQRIPFGQILKEQWWLRQHYPWREEK